MNRANDDTGDMSRCCPACIARRKRNQQRMALARQKRRTEKEQGRHKEIVLKGEATQGVMFPSVSNEAHLPAPVKPVKTKRKRKERRIGFLCPDDFQPTAGNYAVGMTLGYDREGVKRAAAEMCDWSHANANRDVSRKTAWDRALNNWMRKHAIQPNGRTRAASSIGRAAGQLADNVVTLAARPVLSRSG